MPLWARRTDSNCPMVGDRDDAQKVPEPGEDAAEVVADRGEDTVGGIASAQPLRLQRPR